MVITDDQQRAVFGLPLGSRLRTLVTQRWRMTIAQGDPYGELYDLQRGAAGRPATREIAMAEKAAAATCAQQGPDVAVGAQVDEPAC
jgi:hypothetical protein